MAKKAGTYKTAKKTAKTVDLKPHVGTGSKIGTLLFQAYNNGDSPKDIVDELKRFGIKASVKDAKKALDKLEACAKWWLKVLGVKRQSSS